MRLMLLFILFCLQFLQNSVLYTLGILATISCIIRDDGQGIEKQEKEQIKNIIEGSETNV